MLKHLLNLFHSSPQKLFSDGPVLPIPGRSHTTPGWVKNISAPRQFASSEEAAAYAASLENAHELAHEQSGQLEAEAEAEMRAALGCSLANERPH